MKIDEFPVTRVVVDFEGYGVPPGIAARDYGIKELAVIFKREDGWTLGAPAELQVIAYSIWKDSWIEFTEDGKNWSPIKNY